MTIPVGKCQCGCGGETKSRFVPGHDAQLKSRLLRAYKDAESQEEIRARLKDLGWLYMVDPSVPKPIKAKAKREFVPRQAKAHKKYALLPEPTPAEREAERAIRQQKASIQLDRERAQILRDLEAFGSTLCEACGHWTEEHDHVAEVCRRCLEGAARHPAFQDPEHTFRSLLDEAREFFASPGATA